MGMMKTDEKRLRGVEFRLNNALATISKLGSQVQALREQAARANGQGQGAGGDGGTMYCWLTTAVGQAQNNVPGSGSAILVYRDSTNGNVFTDYGFAAVTVWNYTPGNPQADRYGIVARDGQDYKLLGASCLDGATAPAPAPAAGEPASAYPASGMGAAAANFATMGLAEMGLR